MAVRLPKSIFWELSYYCNEKCKMCPIYGIVATGRKLLRKNPLTSSQIDDILVDIANAYGTKKPRLKLTGGEPFLRKDIFDILSRIKDIGFPFGMMTNFTLVQGSTLERFLEYNPKFLNVSIDGPKEVHNAIRRKKGSFETTFKNLATYLVRKGESNISFEVNCVITDWNILYLDALVPICRELGLPLTLQHLNFLEKDELEEQRIRDRELFGREIFHLTTVGGLSNESLDSLVSKINEIKELAEKQSVKLKFKPELKDEEIEGYYGGKLSYKLACGFLKDSLRISPFGELSPCMDYSAGSLLEKGFNELIKSSEMKELRRKLNKVVLPVCRRCCKVNL